MSEDEETKECPKCAETIKAKATVCRFCQHDFTANKQQQKSSGSKGSGCLTFCLILVALCLVPMFYGCIRGMIAGPEAPSSTSNTKPSTTVPNKPAYKEPDEPLQLDDKSLTDQDGYIVGKVKNTSKKRGFRLVRVHFNLFDGDGANIGSARDSCTHLGPGETWKFKAYTFNRDFSTYRLESLDGLRE